MFFSESIGGLPRCCRRAQTDLCNVKHDTASVRDAISMPGIGRRPALAARCVSKAIGALPCRHRIAEVQKWAVGRVVVAKVWSRIFVVLKWGGGRCAVCAAVIADDAGSF